MPGISSLLLLTFVSVVIASSACNNVAWGTFQEAIYSSDVVTVNQNFDNAVGRSQNIFHVYVNWDDGYQGPNNNDFSYWGDFPKWVESMMSYTSVGVSTRTPLITWQPWGSPYTASNNKYPFSAISAGNFDTYIDSFFKVMKTLGPLVYVRLAHEFDGDWYPWGAVNGNTGAGFQSMWQHVVGRAVATNTTNVKFVWCPNNSNSKGVYFENYYPGDNYVDWVCLDAYADNSAVSFYQTISTAASPAQPYQRLVTLTKSAKPVMIAEFGMITNNDTIYGNWFKTMMSELQTSSPLIKALVFFNTMSYKMNTASTALTTSVNYALTSGGNCTGTSVGVGVTVGITVGTGGGNDIVPSGNANTNVPQYLAFMMLVLLVIYH